MKVPELRFVFLVLIVFVLFGFSEETYGYPCQAQYEACLEACPSLGCQDQCADNWLFNCPEGESPPPPPPPPSPPPPPPPPVQISPPPPIPISPPAQPEPEPSPSRETPEGQCASWKKSGQERYRGDEVTILTDVASVECEVRTRVSVQSGPHQDIIENRYRYFYEGKQFCKEIVRFTNNIESARGKDCAEVPTETETRKLEFGKDVNAGDIMPLQENTRYVLVMPAGQVFVKETAQEKADGPSLGSIVITGGKEGMIEMSLEEGFYYFHFKKVIKSLSGSGSEDEEVLDFLTSLSIVTRLAALRVKGTEFTVEVIGDGTTAIHVLDGTVTVSDRTSGNPTEIPAGFGTIVMKDERLRLVEVKSGDYDPWWKNFPQELPEPEQTPKTSAGIMEIVIAAGIGATVAATWFVTRKIKKRRSA